MLAERRMEEVLLALEEAEVRELPERETVRREAVHQLACTGLSGAACALVGGVATRRLRRRLDDFTSKLRAM